MNLANLFTLATLTTAINTLPTPPTRLGKSGLFEEKPVPTTYVVIENRNGTLTLVENTNRDDDPKQTGNKKRQRRTFELMHLPESGKLLPSELNVAAFGESDQAEDQAKVINDKLQDMKNNVETTIEYHRVGAISGIIYDADGSVIYNLYNEFGITEKVISIDFSNPDEDVRGKLREAKRYAEKALGVSLVTGWLSYCSASFYDQLVNHAQVKEAFKGWQAAGDRLAEDMREGFSFEGITFIEYEVSVGSTKFIDDDVSRLVPKVKGLFKQFYGPANYNETVNTLGKPMYAKAEERSLGKGWKLEAQSNPLAMCTAPGALVKLLAT